MFRRKALVYQFTSEGMEEMEFVDAGLKVKDLVAEYERLQYAVFEEEEEWEA